MYPMTFDVAKKICKYMDDKKARDILMIDIEDRSVVADCFVIASGRSDQQVRSIADEVEDKMEADNSLTLLRKEGYREGRWIVLDYGDILVHIFHQEEREHYDLERLWADGENVTRYVEGE